MQSILNIDCSMFNNARATNPVTVNLLNWLMSKEYISKQSAVRAAKDPDTKDKAKKEMPSITPSGTFSKRGKSNLIQHTGLISIDVDGKDNQHIENFKNLKIEMAKIQNVAYCGLSVSGTGYWLLIPISDAGKHDFHFEFIRQYFLNKNIIIDKACKDVARLRFYSYDADAYFNHEAKPLLSYYKPKEIVSKKTPTGIYRSYGKPVWEQYNEGDHFINVLENHNWKIDSKRGSKTFFTRPGKMSGVSAEYDGVKNVFFVFTENGQPFESNKGYNPFQVYTLLHHNGNFSASARALITKLN